MDTAAQNILEKKIGRLREYMSKLSPYVALPNDAIMTNQDKLLAMERSFQLVVDEAIDINALVSYQLGGKVSDSYKSTFYELVPLGIVEQSFADVISESAKVRNQLTHDYDKLSQTEIVSSIKRFFELYKTYLDKLIKRFIVQ
jgi:uncharacterized protein YutE (UPF0331/DUF86 family)